ncbi:MAG TPA: hypothetical protein VKF79_06515, partial [Candidatus Acidoferrum sp.]|nr:hypothetical protein [Candidatus Acidoferrum sp.]
MSAHSGFSSVASQTADLFALTDEQILQIEPDAQDVQVFDGERSDRMDPLREDLQLLASGAARPGADQRQQEQGNQEHGNAAAADDGGKAVATSTNITTNATAQNSTSTNAASNNSAEAPHWLAERMNDPRHGAEARELWQGAHAARQEASAFREVFAKPEDARAAASRARMLDEIDRAYFGAPGNAPEQISASRAQLAATMLREDPAAFREMVFAGLRALEAAGQPGSGARNEFVAPPFRAASSGDAAQATQAAVAEIPSPPTPGRSPAPSPTPSSSQSAQQPHATTHHPETQPPHEAR